MPTTHKKYIFKGLDLRTNRLYRSEGTASDCRNVYLDGSGNLLKRWDVATNVIPRGTEFETGEFLDKLNFNAEIVDIMPFREDYIVLVVRSPYIGSMDIPFRNQFYRWYPSTNTVSFIPLSCEMAYQADIGYVTALPELNVNGKFQHTNKENCLFFCGSGPIVGSGYVDETGEKYRLSPMFVFDGVSIARAGVPAFLSDTTEDVGNKTAANHDYVRIVPFKWDDTGRWIFGSYSTHLSTYNSPSRQDLVISEGAVNYEYTRMYSSYFYATSVHDATSGQVTYNADITINEGTGISVGQRVMVVKTALIQFPFGTPTNGETQFNIYRGVVADVDTINNRITLNTLEKYNHVTAIWDVVTSFPSITNTFFSNLLYAAYKSDDFAFGFDLVGLFALGRTTLGTVNHTLSYWTDKGTSTLLAFGHQGEPAFIQDNFEDMYDEVTVKLPLPRVTGFSELGTTFLMVDQDYLYYTDLSLGGSIENVEPLDNFSRIGSTNFGAIRGIFSNENFAAVYRDHETYYISGNILTGQYRVQSSESLDIGLSDPKSILKVSGSGISMSYRGVYSVSQGGSSEELSDSIEPLFTEDALGFTLDLTQCKGQINAKEEYLYFLTSTSDGWKILAYSTYHGEWTIFEGIDGSGGFVVWKSLSYISDGTNVFSQTTTNENSFAYYQSNFETLGEPSLLKKFLQVVLFGTRMTDPYTVGIEAYNNWDSDTPTTSENETIGGGKRLVTRRLNPTRTYSTAIRIVSQEGNGLILDGYEYEYQADTTRAINED